MLYNGSWEGKKMDKLHAVYGHTRLAIQRNLNGYQAATDDIPSSLSPPLIWIACRAFLESIPCFNICENGVQKRNGWLKGFDLKTIKYAAGVSKKLKDLLWNFSLSLALSKKHILITIKCVCSHLVISLVHFSVWFCEFSKNLCCWLADFSKSVFL